jgi:hypothetical protein
MKRFILITIFLMVWPVAEAQAASVDIPVSVQIIGYTDSKRICCLSSDSHDWCSPMVPHLWFLNDMIFDDRTEFVPQKAMRCA